MSDNERHVAIPEGFQEEEGRLILINEKKEHHLVEVDGERIIFYPMWDKNRKVFWCLFPHSRVVYWRPSSSPDE